MSSRYGLFSRKSPKSPPELRIRVLLVVELLVGWVSLAELLGVLLAELLGVLSVDVLEHPEHHQHLHHARKGDQAAETGEDAGKYPGLRQEPPGQGHDHDECCGGAADHHEHAVPVVGVHRVAVVDEEVVDDLDVEQRDGCEGGHHERCRAAEQVARNRYDESDGATGVDAGAAVVQGHRKHHPGSEGAGSSRPCHEVGCSFGGRRSQPGPRREREQEHAGCGSDDEGPHVEVAGVPCEQGGDGDRRARERDTDRRTETSKAGGVDGEAEGPAGPGTCARVRGVVHVAHAATLEVPVGAVLVSPSALSSTTSECARFVGPQR